ncbi:MAG: hypothetical protein PW786_10740 [Arachidicoccus sp.]|nr:hypothetical protein [Arachidicoccus sp.]
MKKLAYLSFGFILILGSCGRKNVPQQTATPVHPKVAPDRINQQQYIKKAVIINGNSGQGINDTYTNPNNNANTATTANNLAEPVVVIDSHGMLKVDSLILPPDVSHNLDSLNQATRAFTPDQAKNLAHRFNQIPPRVLLVPNNLAKKGVKGYYYKYQNKFWYWKKDDGYFYLDENYYQ